MTLRFNENDVGTSGANNILLTDENGKIPVLDGSALTNISSNQNNGANYTYETTSSTSFTPSVDKFYYITQANLKSSLGGNTVVIDMPYNSDLINGSKFGFFYIPTNSAINGGQYQLVTPLNSSLASQGWTSFELWIEGGSYSNGAIYTSKQGANRTRELYAYVNGTDLKWFVVNGGNKTLKEQIINFDLDSTRPYSTNPHLPQLLAVKNNSTLATNGSVANVSNITCQQFGDTALTLSMITTSLNNGYRQHLFTSATTTSFPGPSHTFPAASTTEGLVFLALAPQAPYGSNVAPFGHFGFSSAQGFFYTAASASTSNSWIANYVSGRPGYMIVSNGTNYYIMRW
jgi:hypothetical protein